MVDHSALNRITLVRFQVERPPISEIGHHKSLRNFYSQFESEVGDQRIVKLEITAVF